MKKELIVITGPSCSGKTTLLNELKKEYSIGIPRQITTRQPRKDDNPNLYKYISVKEFEKLKQEGKFAISSGKHERRYGIFKYDIMKCLEKNDLIAIITSYKDISKIRKLNIDSKIIVLTFKNIKTKIEERIRNSGKYPNEKDIMQRIKYALKEHEEYFSDIKKEADIIVYTDVNDINKTKNLVEKSLKSERKRELIEKE